MGTALASWGMNTGAIASSQIWSPQTVPLGNWRGICWSPTAMPDGVTAGCFCAVARTGVNSNQIMTSPDGITWTLRASPLSSNWSWMGICWSPGLGLFCAVSEYGGYVMTSPDGATWTAHSPAETNIWNAVCWSPTLGLFCAVGNQYQGHNIMTSPDGVNWTMRNSPTPVHPYDSFVSIAWSPDLGEFFAVDWLTGYSIYSADGITWYSRTDTDSYQDSVCWSAAVNGSGDFVILDGSDGAVGLWPTPGTTGTFSLSGYRGQIAWSPEKSLFVIVTAVGAVSSPDCITWSAAESGAVPCTAVCWSPDLSIFCAVGYSAIYSAAYGMIRPTS